MEPPHFRDPLLDSRAIKVHSLFRLSLENTLKMKLTSITFFLIASFALFNGASAQEIALETDPETAQETATENGQPIRRRRMKATTVSPPPPPPPPPPPAMTTPKARRNRFLR